MTGAYPISANPYFNILVMDGSPSRGQSIVDVLKPKGYAIQMIHRLEDFFGTIDQFVPHVLICPFEAGNDFPESLRLIKSKLPETHIILTSDEVNWLKAVETLDLGVYDCVEFPFMDERLICRSVERAIERDWLYYQSEQIKEAVKSHGLKGVSLGTQTDTIDENDYSWLVSLGNLNTMDEFIISQLKWLSKQHSDAEVVYFKFLTNQRSVVASYAVHEDLSKHGNMGIRLAEEETPLSVRELLADPKKIPSLNELIKKVFKGSQFYTESLILDEDTLGFYVIFSDAPEYEMDLRNQFKFQSLQQVGRRIHLQKKLHKMNRHDEITGLYNRHHFFVKKSEEISRSRRTQLPLSLIVISIDDGDRLTNNLDQSDVDIVLRGLSKIFERNSRVNDVFGRIGQYEFGMLLPHTPLQGATIKAERLRKIIESADFSKAIREKVSIAVSVGVSEYPSQAADADDLFARSDEAMFEARRQGGNKSCRARAPENFEPDFTVD